MREKGLFFNFTTFTYDYLDLLKAPVKELIKMSSDDFLIRRVAITPIPALSQLNGSNRLDAEIHVVTYCRLPGQTFLPTAIKRFKKAAEAQLLPHFPQVTFKFDYEPFVFPSAQDIESLRECLEKNLEDRPQQIVADSYHYLFELINDPRYTSDFHHYRKHSTDVFNTLSFFLWCFIHHITGDRPSKLDVCGKDDKTRIFISVFQENLGTFQQNNLMTGFRHSIKLQDQDVHLFTQPFSEDQSLTSLQLNTDIMLLIFESELPKKQKLMLLQLLTKMLETLKKRIETTLDPLRRILHFAESFHLMSINICMMDQNFSNDTIARLCGHDLLDLRRLEILEFLPYVIEQLNLHEKFKPILTSLLANSCMLIKETQDAIETLGNQIKLENEAAAKQVTHEKKPDVSTVVEMLDRQTLNTVLLPTTFFNPITNYNKEIRDRLREMGNQSTKHTPTVTEQVTIPVKAEVPASLYMIIAMTNGAEFTIDMHTLAEPNGSARLFQIPCTLTNQQTYVFMHGLIELTKQELEWLQAADGRPLLTKTGRAGNGLKRSSVYHALVLKRADQDTRLIFHYLDVKQDEQNCRVYFPVGRLTHKEYEVRFYRDTTEYQRYWSNIRDELAQQVTLRFENSINEPQPPLAVRR